MSFNFTLSPSKNWKTICEKENNFFNSTPWQELLNRGLNSQTLYGWDDENQRGITLTVFKAGPFNIGYIGFPIGSILGKGFLTGADILEIKTTTLPISIHQLRFSCGAFEKKTKFPFKETQIPETQILNLDSWQLCNMPKLNRDIKKSNRSCFDIKIAVSNEDSKIIYNLYQKTIQRNFGSQKYTYQYFQELVSLSNETPNIHCLLSLLNNQVAGFIITVIDHHTTYYLHAAINLELRKYGVSDKLLYEAILLAKNNNSSKFNLMASPINNKSLIKYKEKWGAETKIQHNYQVDINSLMSKAFEYSIKIYNKLR